MLQVQIRDHGTSDDPSLRQSQTCISDVQR